MKFLLPLLSLAVCSGLYAIDTVDRQLEHLKNQLTYETDDALFYLEGGAQLDWTGYYTDNDNSNPPGFFFPHDAKNYDWSPRLTLTLDSFLGDHLYGFVKFRFDDGVHPGVSKIYGDSQAARWDEFFLRATFLNGALQVQAGQFVPIMGNFLNRQDNWDMGLVSYPMLYEQVTPVSDTSIPASSAAFAARRNASDFPNKVLWLPAYWAQLYTRGVTVFGQKGNWDYSLNFTNRAPSSRSITWNDNDWGDPSWMSSLGYQFNPSWRIGLTGTIGPYLQESAEPGLPLGREVDDYLQRNLGIDLSFKHRHWQVWAELVHTSYEVPNVGDNTEFWSYFIEARYDFKPQWWVSARWNHQIYEEVDGREWDNEHMRIDLGLGHRLGRHTQIKLQYSYQHEDEASGVDLMNAEHFVVLEASLKL